MHSQYLRIFAQYNCQAYGSSTYQDGQVCGAQTTTDPIATPLAKTGFDVIMPLAVGVILIVAAVVIMIRSKRRSTTPATRR